MPKMKKSAFIAVFLKENMNKKTSETEAFIGEK
jgi:hypothetical protein